MHAMRHRLVRATAWAPERNEGHARHPVAVVVFVVLAPLLLLHSHHALIVAQVADMKKARVDHEPTRATR